LDKQNNEEGENHGPKQDKTKNSQVCTYGINKGSTGLNKNDEIIGNSFKCKI